MRIAPRASRRARLNRNHAEPELETRMIDLRSDTVTRPTEAMRAVMAAAPVGDMQYGDDPSLMHSKPALPDVLGKACFGWLPAPWPIRLRCAC